jgi:hypothetical protein
MLARAAWSAPDVILDSVYQVLLAAVRFPSVEKSVL